MPPALFDVFVVGPAVAGPDAEARLAATLAAQSGRTVAAITQALAKRNLRVGSRLPRDVAENVARQLHGLGAAASIVDAVARDPKARPTPTPPPVAVQGFAPLATPASARQPTTNPGGGFTLTPLSGTPSVRMGNPPTGPNLSLAPLGGGLGGSAFEAPPSGSFGHNERYGERNGERPPARPAPPPRAIAPNAFSVPAGDAGEVSLELARELPAPKKSVPTSTSISSMNQPAYTVAGASGLNTSKIIATSSTSGLALSDDEEAHTERCAKHGLLFDRRKSKGCRRCVQNRKSASITDDGSRPRLRETPAKRAFMGFGIALLLGFAPAAYYAKHPGAAEVDRLRTEQTELSEKPGTEAVLRRFEQIDGLVSASQTRAIRNTLFIWVAAGGLVMFGFYRAT